MGNTNIKNHSLEMMNIIQEWEQSGQSQKLFCQARSIPHSKFYYWLRKLREDQSPVSETDFIAVRIKQNKMQGAMDIHYPNGVVVKLHAPVDMIMVKTLLQIL
jgi:predicted acetyltransferase